MGQHYVPSWNRLAVLPAAPNDAKPGASEDAYAQRAGRLGEKRFAAFLASYSYCSLSARELLAWRRPIFGHIDLSIALAFFDESARFCAVSLIKVGRLIFSNPTNRALILFQMRCTSYIAVQNAPRSGGIPGIGPAGVPRISPLSRCG